MKTPTQRNAELALKRKQAAARLDAVGRNVVEALEFQYPDATVTFGTNTSNAPLIAVAFPDGDIFHVTVTKARK